MSQLVSCLWCKLCVRIISRPILHKYHNILDAGVLK